MPATRLGIDQVNRLAHEVREKIVAKAAVIAEAKGPITIRVIPRSTGGFDIDLTVTT